MKWRKAGKNQSDRMYERIRLDVGNTYAIVGKVHPLLCGPRNTWGLKSLHGVSRGWEVRVFGAGHVVHDEVFRRRADAKRFASALLRRRVQFAVQFADRLDAYRVRS